MLRLKHGKIVLVAMCVIAVLAGPAMSQRADKAKEPPGTGNGEQKTEAVTPPGASDSMQRLADAWFGQDAATLADEAERLAEAKAETADDAALLALQAASRTGNKAVIEKLEKMARDRKNPKLLEEISAVNRLGAPSRGPEVKISADSVTPDQLRGYQKFGGRLDIAADPEEVARLEKDIKDSDLPKTLQDALSERAKLATERAAATDNDLQKLLHGSRPSGRQSQSKAQLRIPTPGSGYYSRRLRGHFVFRSNFTVPGYPPFPGVRVSTLDWGSPLRAAGIRTGDVISRLDGVRIWNVGELDRHYARTSVRWIRAGSNYPRVSYVNLGSLYPGPGPGPGPGPWPNPWPNPWPGPWPGPSPSPGPSP